MPIVTLFRYEKNDDLSLFADNYGSTPGGNLAKFYAGLGLLKQGKYDEAIEHLDDFKSSDLLVQARAYALLGDAYMEKKSYDEAASSLYIDGNSSVCAVSS